MHRLDQRLTWLGEHALHAVALVNEGDSFYMAASACQMWLSCEEHRQDWLWALSCFSRPVRLTLRCRPPLVDSGVWHATPANTPCSPVLPPCPESET